MRSTSIANIGIIDMRCEINVLYIFKVKILTILNNRWLNNGSSKHIITKCKN